MTEKETFYATSAAPGPGAYREQSGFGTTGQGPTMAPRRPRSAVSRVPGPGSYDIANTDKPKGPTYT